MWKVDIYLETDSTFQGKKHRRCGYVLATQLRTGEKTKGGFGYTEGTYHQAILKTLGSANTAAKAAQDQTAAAKKATDTLIAQTNHITFQIDPKDGGLNIAYTE